MGIRAHDAVEEGKDDEKEGKDIGNDGETGRERTDPLPPTGLEQKKQHRHQKHISRRRRIGGKPRGPIPKRPIDRSANHRNRDLRHDIRRAERHPAINTRRQFPRLPQRAIGIELRHNGVDDGGGDEQDQKGGEHSVLHVADRVAELPEGEAVEDADDDGDEQFAVEVGRVAPALDEEPFGEHGGLQPDGGGEGVLGGFIVFGEFAAFGVDAVDLVQDYFVFGGVFPLFVPVDSIAAASLVALCGCFEDEFSDVFRGRAFDSAVFEVFDHGATALSYGSEIEGVSAGVQGEDHVELLDKN